MMNLPYEEIVEKIKEKSGWSSEEIKSKIDAKMNELAGLISKEGAAHIIANEVGVKVFSDSNELKIKSIVPGMRGIEVIGKVTHKFNINEFKSDKVEGGIGKVGSFVINDGTGSLRIVLWHGKTKEMDGFNVGDILKLSNGYVKENQNGYKEMHLGEKGEIIVNPDGVEVDLEPKYKLTYMKDMKPNDFVEVIGSIVQVGDLRFYEVCPECGKRTKIDENGEFVCSVHGKIEPTFAYLLNVFVDDGSANVRAVMFREQVEKILGKKSDELLDAKGNYEVLENFKHELLGDIVKLKGRVNENKMFDRTEIVVEDVVKDIDPEKEIERLKESQ